MENKSQKRIDESLDIARLIRSQSRFSQMEQMLLTGQQRFLIKLLENKARLVSDSDSSDDPVHVEPTYGELDLPHVVKILQNASLKSTLDKRLARAVLKQFESIKVTFAD